MANRSLQIIKRTFYFQRRKVMQLKPIGYIQSPIKQPKFGGWQNLITEIVIDPSYRDGYGRNRRIFPSYCSLLVR